MLSSTYRLHAIDELHLYNNVSMSRVVEAVVENEALGVNDMSDSKASKDIYIQSGAESGMLNIHPRQQRK